MSPESPTDPQPFDATVASDGGVPDPLDTLADASPARDPRQVDRQDQVNDLLSSVSEQLQRLRALQEAHEAEVETLSRLETSLEDREKALHAERTALESERETLDAASHRLEAEQSSWRDEHGAAERGLQERVESIEQRQADMQEREQELSREVAHAEDRCSFDGERERLEARALALEERESEVELTRAAVATESEQAIVELDRVQARLNEVESGLAREREGFESDIGRMRSRLRELEEELAGARARQEADETEAGRMSTEHTDAQAHVASLVTELERVRDALEQAETELARARAESDEARAQVPEEDLEARRLAEAELERLRQEHERSAEFIAEAEAEREAARERVHAAEATASEVADRAQKLEAELQSAVERANGAEAQAERMSAEHREATTRGSEFEAERQAAQERVHAAEAAALELEAERDEALGRAREFEAQLQSAAERAQAAEAEAGRLHAEQERSAAHGNSIDEELRAAREQNQSAAAEADAARAERDQALKQFAGIEEELSRLRRAVRVDPEKLDAAVEELKRLRSERSERIAALAEAERCAKDAVSDALRLEEQCEILRTDSGAGDSSPDDPALRRERDDLARRLEEYQAATEQAMSVAESMQRRVTELEEQLHNGDSAPSDVGGDPAAVTALEAKIEELSSALHHEKSKSGKRSEQDMERHAANLRSLETRERELHDKQSQLVKSETRMRRRWARQRSAVGVAACLFITLVSLGGAWLAVNRAMPALVSASTLVTAKSPDGSPLDDAELELWQTWHTEIVRSESFHKAVAQRMEERRLTAYESEESVRDLLTRDLTIDSAEPGAITYTLAGRDQIAMLDALDIVVTTISAESRRQARHRAGGAVVQVRGEHEAKGRVRYAALNPMPIEDRRLQFFGVFFGGIFALLLVAVAMLYSRLVRAKREFDDDAVLLGDEPVKADA